MKALHRLTNEQLQRSRKLTPDQVIGFLEHYRRLHFGQPSPSKMVSIRIPADLLEAFKVQAYIHGTPYQTQIKKLMRDWVLRPDSD
jgi:predicted DNA binding CopG/RHH family protein